MIYLVEQIPRYCLVWLLAAQLALIAPHAERLPLWLLGAWAACALWRGLVFAGRVGYPPRWLKLVLILGSVAGIGLSYGQLVGLEPMVALLIAGSGLKLVESAGRRDAYLIIYLSYFLAITAFLFEQGIGLSIYMVLAVTLVTAALLSLHQSSAATFSWQPLRSSAVMMAQAVPLMLLLFLVFPRFAPLWQVPAPSQQATTGVSDSMAPGEIAQLSQSGALAFRASFEEAAPPARELYWRGVVMSRFDGRRWTAVPWQASPLSPREKAALLPAAAGLRYSVVMEPTHQSWLFALKLPHSETDRVVLTHDFRLQATNIIHDKFRYDVVSWLDAQLQTELPAIRRQLETQLPAAGNPRARSLAQQLMLEHGAGRGLIDAVLAMYRNQPFVYTLKPPLLGQNPVDEFLFETRRGFCEHYASSFVFLMRAAGLPARVVTGYQGGELNPISQTVLVHQFDAHAWAEVWLDGEGWVRVDPTAAVAPSRIERGLEDALGETEPFLEQSPLSPLRYRHIRWLNTLRLRLDAFNYYWVSFVLNYRGEVQLSALEGLLGKVTPTRVAFLLVGGGALVLAGVGLRLLRRRGGDKSDPATRVYRRFCRRLARRGIAREVGEAPGDFAARVGRERPEFAEAVWQVTRYYQAYSYQRLPVAQQARILAQLRRAAAQLPGL